MDRLKSIKAMKKANGSKGFTLIEVIVVLVIIAIMAAVTIPAMIGFINDARGKAYAAEARVGLVAAQAVVTQLIAAGNTTPSAHDIISNPTFTQMVSDVTDSSGFSDIIVGTLQDSNGNDTNATNRILQIIYTVTSGKTWYIEIKGGTTNVYNTAPPDYKGDK